MVTRTDLLPHEEYLKSLPRKRSAVGAVILHDGKLLVVKPNYKDCWLLPGGTIDEMEAPYAAMQRELQEELGITPPIGRLLVVDYRQEENVQSSAAEVLHFLFAVTLDAPMFAAIKLQAEELDELRLIEPTQADQFLSPHGARRVQLALAALHNQTHTAYAENGKLIV